MEESPSSLKDPIILVMSPRAPSHIRSGSDTAAAGRGILFLHRESKQSGGDWADSKPIFFHPHLRNRLGRGFLLLKDGHAIGPPLVQSSMVQGAVAAAMSQYSTYSERVRKWWRESVFPMQKNWTRRRSWICTAW